MGPTHYLPAWYPRELGGTPFRANIQSFPFIPTRFPLLLFEPHQAYLVGVEISALLAAVFTYLYCRRVGIGRIAAAVGGWTFACSGYFASRTMVGHLPLLEAYPSLPLLLWLTEVHLQLPAVATTPASPLLAIDSNRRRTRRVYTFIAMALASCCMALLDKL